MWQDEKAAAIQEGSPDALLSRAQMWNKYPKPLVAIDRDGVLIKCKDVVKSVESFEPIEGSLSAISMIRSNEVLRKKQLTWYSLLRTCK